MKRKLSPKQSAFVVTAVVLLAVLHAGAKQSAPATFAALGPAGIITDDPNGPRAGAINSLVAHPLDPDTIWVGAVNGGVWKTTNATHSKPHWVALTDHQASLSIAALALDPTYPNPDVLVAGIGAASSFGNTSGPLTGLLRTADGGDHWTPLGRADLSGESITGVAPRGQVIVVSAATGIWRSADKGATFRHLGHSGGPLRQRATDLVGDPVNPDVLYAGIVGPGGGVFRSEDTGKSWDNISDVTFGQRSGDDLVSDARKIVLSVHDDGDNDVVYAGIVGEDKNPSGVFRSTDRGASWTALDVPPLEQADQGRLSIIADPRFPNLVYLGGDEPSDGGAGPIYRCNAFLPRLLQCTSVSGTGTRDGSHPHADSRRMQFDAAGDLLETDDGGIFKDARPRSRFGSWVSVNGDLSITETHSCAWDHVRHVPICGTQDNGTATPQGPGAPVWTSLHGEDGGDVAVFNSPAFSIAYYSGQHLDGFTRQVCIGPFCVRNKPSLTVHGFGPIDTFDPTLALYKGPRPTPIATHPLHPARLAIATGIVYESEDSGNTLIPLGGFSGLSTRAMAFGSASHHDVLYVGSSQGLFLHTTRFAQMNRITAYHGGPPAGVALDPSDWRSAWVVDSNSVWHTPDGGSTWHDVTGNLGPGDAGAQELHAIAFVPGSSASLIFVGASDGLYAASTAHPRHWHKLRGALPNVIVYDLDYDAADDLLLVATLGRGAWTIASPGEVQLPPPTN